MTVERCVCCRTNASHGFSLTSRTTACGSHQADTVSLFTLKELLLGLNTLTRCNSLSHDHSSHSKLGRCKIYGNRILNLILTGHFQQSESEAGLLIGDHSPNESWMTHRMIISSGGVWIKGEREDNEEKTHATSTVNPPQLKTKIHQRLIKHRTKKRTRTSL